jgi:lipopolysaccharide/colanic/teichoic acid biosynthesis glycosyltransferase
MADIHTGVEYQNVRARQRRSLLTFGENLDAFIWKNLHLQPDDEVVKVLATATPLNLELIENDSCSCIINLKRINDVRYISKFLQTANAKLPRHGYYITRVETKNQRVQNLMNRFPWPLGWLVSFTDFIFHRVLPKIPVTRKAYYWATKGQNRVLTLSETLGRLISCGFGIVDHKEIDGHTWIVARKEQAPGYNENPTYGVLVKLRRVGMDGKLINVYKLRTMHPFSEYIQEYVYLNNNLKEGGKLDNDYRITSWGRVMRKLWIDELPMIWNLLRGEMKLVGVRPLSQHYFHLYPEDVQRLRIRTRPGLVPPFYADLPRTFEEIVESERRYLFAYNEHPLRTDISYFFKAVKNILIRKARSG